MSRLVAIQIFIIFYSIVSFITVNCAVDEKVGGVNNKAVPFMFAEYAYKETSKNEITYHDFELACESADCMNLAGVAKLNCIRRCISPSCYQDIYAFDELEEGEIDVRLNSFKGCVIQRTGSNWRI